MTQTFDNVFDRVLETIGSGGNIMLHGAGGVGKSYLIKKLRDKLGGGWCVVLTSTTGVSAFNVGDGCVTINSFAGILTGEKEPEYYVRRCRKSPTRVKELNQVQLLVIDEISMLGKSIIEKLDVVFRVIRKTPKPFGGIQVLFAGDFYQLPPVKDDWCFHSKVWDDLNLEIHNLSKPQRHKSDKPFFRMLMRIREGKPKKKDLIALQGKHIKYFQMTEEERSALPAVMLFPTNNNVDHYNQSRLDELEEKEFIYSATYSTKEAKKASRSVLGDNDVLVFKKGSQVMLTVNLDVTEGLVNGATGIVESCGPGYVHVRFVNGVSKLMEKYEYIIDEEQGIKAWQIPLRLAWAISIHKSQSATIDMVVIDLGNCFENGQAYVALSRCRSLDGIYLTDFNTKSIKVNGDVVDFFATPAPDGGV